MNKVMKHDHVYEKANEMKPSFEEYQYRRGLAMLDYIQATIILKKFKKVNEFKRHMLDSVKSF